MIPVTQRWRQSRWPWLSPSSFLRVYGFELDFSAALLCSAVARVAGFTFQGVLAYMMLLKAWAVVGGLFAVAVLAAVMGSWWVAGGAVGLVSVGAYLLKVDKDSSTAIGPS